jgi:putative long chain acyl-CoA synthase
VLPSGARSLMGTIPCVDLVVGYGVKDGGSKVLVIAATLRPGTQMSSADLDNALDKLPQAARPRYVQVVPSIPVTTWHRPQWRSLQAKGVPTPTRTRKVWRLGADGAHYEQVT